MKLTKTIIDDFINRSIEIRKLSASVYSTDGKNFSEKMNMNFKEIGRLAQENKPVIDSISELLSDDYQLSDDELNLLVYISNQILDAYAMENLDLMLELKVCEKIYKHSLTRNDQNVLVPALDKVISSAYAMLNLTKRISSVNPLSTKYFKLGLDAAKHLYEYLDHVKFNELTNENKELVLINIRYSSALYEGCKTSWEYDEEIKLLNTALKLSTDDFFKANIEGYDWEYHLLRTYQYFGLLEEPQKIKYMSKEILFEVITNIEKLMALWNTDVERFKEIIEESELKLLYARAKYYAEQMTKAEYKKTLLSIYEHRTLNSYSLTNILINILVPYEYISLVDKDKISERDKLIIESFYQTILTYVYNFKNAGSLSYMLEYLAFILESFVEIPGGITCLDMCLECMASLHMPTYIHSKMVGKISSCIGEYLYNENKQIYYSCFNDLNKITILNYIYSAGLTHDFGKLPIIDTIFIYGRRLTDEEFSMVKSHPEMSRRILLSQESTKDYADVAYHHHLFYDYSKGYPLNPIPDNHKLITDIVTIADCMDAATDSIGRSYNTGKTLEQFIEELNQGSGTRYNPVIVELFKNKEFIEDIRFILTEGRKETYKASYAMLKSLQDEGRF